MRRTTSVATGHVCTHTIRVHTHSRRNIWVHTHSRRNIRVHPHTRRRLRHDGNGGRRATGGSASTSASEPAPRRSVVTPSPVLRDGKQSRRWRKPVAAI